MPALSDLISCWVEEYFQPVVRVKGPDDYFPGFFYIDTKEGGIWLADIDNATAEVTLRDRYGMKSDRINAADPSLLERLDTHIRRRLAEIESNRNDD